jgi:hypothetical protein
MKGIADMGKKNMTVTDREENITRKGDKVSFCVSDVFLPTAEELLKPLSSDTKVEGTIIDFSDSGSEPRVFAVIEVVKKNLVVVPVSELEVIETEN